MLELVVWPAPILKKKTEDVTVFDDELKFFSEQMFETMYAHRGIGLAAPQVGLNKRMLVMNCGDDPLVMVNPILEAVYGNKIKMSEGCLSFPGFLVDVERPESCIVAWQDLGGNEEYHEFRGLEARCIQHEIDHLDGITFLRYISSFHRKMIEKKMEKRSAGH